METKFGFSDNGIRFIFLHEPETEAKVNFQWKFLAKCYASISTQISELLGKKIKNKNSISAHEAGVCHMPTWIPV